MKRREFIALLGGAAAVPLAARAQQTGRMRGVGVLMSFAESDPEGQARVTAFEQTLEQLGWKDAHKLNIHYRWASGGLEHLRAGASELVRLSPEVLVANSTPAVAVLRQEAGTIPIVFAQVTDPVGSGFVASLARPGGNLTGFTLSEFTMGAKWIELLREIDPRLTRVAFFFNPQAAPYAEQFLRRIDTASLSLIEVLSSPVRDTAEIEHTIQALAREPNRGVVLLPDAFNTIHRDLIIGLVARYRLPAIYPFRAFVTRGGLMSYGSDTVHVYRQAASYVDRILRGEKPSNLPVQAPTKYELVINLKTAKALGLDVPLFLQQRADEVIE